MGCAVTKNDMYRKQQWAEERKLNEYWYDREEHLITVHEPSSIADPADLRTDFPQTKEQEMLLRGAVGLSDIKLASEMPEKAAKVLLDLESIRRDSGIDIDSCTGEEEEEEEEDEDERMKMLQASAPDAGDSSVQEFMLPPKTRS